MQRNQRWPVFRSCNTLAFFCDISDVPFSSSGLRKEVQRNRAARLPRGRVVFDVEMTVGRGDERDVEALGPGIDLGLIEALFRRLPFATRAPPANRFPAATARFAARGAAHHLAASVLRAGPV